MKDLQLYQQEHEAVQRMRETLQKLMPGGTKLNPDEAEAVAHVAVQHKLDPFNGEVWGLKGNNGKWYGVMVGIKGLRKHARQQMRDLDGSYWTTLMRVDPAKYSAAKHCIVYECHLYDTQNTQAYTHAVHDLREAGVPYEDVIAMLGKSPKVVGVGIFTPGEPTKMKPDAVAMKRAEADAIKQRFDVTWATVDTRATDELSSGNDEEWFDSPVIMESNEVKTERELMQDLSFDTDPEPVLGEYEDDPGWIDPNSNSPYHSVITSKGTFYRDLDKEQLDTIVSVAKERIKAMGDDVSENDMPALDQWQFNLDAANYYLDRMESEV
jgi:hypothetical protein